MAGIPSYLVVAELATCRVLRGHLPPAPSYPAPLRISAPRIWWANAQLILAYARDNHAREGRLAECAGLLETAAAQAAHAVLAARGEWVTNEKSLITRAGLRAADHIIAHAQPATLQRAVDELRTVCEAAVRRAVDGR